MDLKYKVASFHGPEIAQALAAELATAGWRAEVSSYTIYEVSLCSQPENPGRVHDVAYAFMAKNSFIPKEKEPTR